MTSLHFLPISSELSKALLVRPGQRQQNNCFVSVRAVAALCSTDRAGPSFLANFQTSTGYSTGAAMSSPIFRSSAFHLAPAPDPALIFAVKDGLQYLDRFSPVPEKARSDGASHDYVRRP